MFRNELVSDWVGREADQCQLWSELGERSILLVGPRRIGKTELLTRMAREPAPGWRLMRADVQAATSVDDGLRRIEGALRRADGGAGAQVSDLEAAEVGPVRLEKARSSSDRWDRLGDAIRAAVEAGRTDHKLVIALDEVPWWIDAARQSESDAAARAALAGLRYLRQRDDLRRRLRWILTGSVGLASLARALDAAAEINDLRPDVALGPLTVDAGTTLAETTILARGARCDPDAAELCHEEAGGSPHWIKWLATRSVHGARAASGEGPATVRRSDVQSALDAIAHPRSGRDLFDDEGRTHLRKRYGTEEARAITDLLTAVSEAPGGLSEAQAQASLQQAMKRPDRARARNVIHELIESWYLEPREGGALHFVNPLFLRWWRAFGGLP